MTHSPHYNFPWNMPYFYPDARWECISSTPYKFTYIARQTAFGFLTKEFSLPYWGA